MRKILMKDIGKKAVEVAVWLFIGLLLTVAVNLVVLAVAMSVKK